MDFTIHRRAGGATYGKNRNKVFVHDFFDGMPKDTSATTSVPITKYPITPSSASSTDLKHDPVPLQPLSPSPAPRPAHITAHSTSSRNDSDVSRSVSPLRRANMSTSANNLSVFDLSPSDGEVNDAPRDTSKRRKLKHAPRAVEATDILTGPEVSKLSTARHNSVKKYHNKVVKSSGENPEFVQNCLPTVKAPPVKTTKSLGPRASKQPIKSVKENKPPIRKKTASKEIVQLSSPSDSEDAVAVENEDMLERTPRSKRQKPPPALSSHALMQQTPQKSQALAFGSDTPSPSPSHLAMVDLQLSSNSPSPQAVISANPLPRGRKRLIDRLDAPLVSSSRSKSPASSTEPRKAKEPLKVNSAPQPLERSNSLQSRQTYGKPRNVYGRERSHLADMVDDLDMLSAGSSQEASQQLALQLTATSQSSQLNMELELESDSSDDIAVGGKLKSIHELRQAGSINRFERDLEALMEDVDPTSRTSTTALRIPALMKMIKKTADSDFTNFMSDKGFDRLTSWYSSIKDSPAKLLVAILLWRISHLKSVPPVKLAKIADVLTSSSTLLSLETMKEMIRNSKETLGKSLLREWIKIEDEVISEKLLPSSYGRDILPAAIILGSLSRCLRQLLDTGNSEVFIPRKFLVSTFELLDECAHRDLAGKPEIRYIIQCTFSVLEMSTGPLDIEMKASTSQTNKLAQNLGTIVEASLDKYDELVQSALRFAISFCNYRPDICHSFSSVQFIQSQTRIIRTRFLRLVGAAERGEEVRQDMVDSIILCLACLLNLTEHEDDLRRQVAHTQLSASTETSLQSLVSIYKSAAPVLVGATTDGHGQVLVALGYLSLLLCTLSLVADLRTEIDTLLAPLNMTDVVVSGKELLMHLSTLEAFQSLENGNAMADNEAPEVNEFTKRFGQILAAVRLD